MANNVFPLADESASQCCERLGLKLLNPQPLSEDRCKDCIFLSLSLGFRKVLSCLQNMVTRIVTWCMPPLVLFSILRITTKSAAAVRRPLDLFVIAL
jgi:hypothetical protein